LAETATLFIDKGELNEYAETDPSGQTNGTSPVDSFIHSAGRAGPSEWVQQRKEAFRRKIFSGGLRPLAHFRLKTGPPARGNKKQGKPAEIAFRGLECSSFAAMFTGLLDFSRQQILKGFWAQLKGWEQQSPDADEALGEPLTFRPAPESVLQHSP
jgi:hypothetical protein